MFRVVTSNLQGFLSTPLRPPTNFHPYNSLEEEEEESCHEFYDNNNKCKASICENRETLDAARSFFPFHLNFFKIRENLPNFELFFPLLLELLLHAR